MLKTLSFWDKIDGIINEKTGKLPDGKASFFTVT